MIFYGFHGGGGFVVTLLYPKTHGVVNIQYVQLLYVNHTSISWLKKHYIHHS